MAVETEEFKHLDGHLVSALVSGRQRLGVAGEVELPGPDGLPRNYLFFYDFVLATQEPLLPVGVINSAQEISQDFGEWQTFFHRNEDFVVWGQQVDTTQFFTNLSIARAYLCSTGKLQLPDSEALIEQTLNERIEGQPLGFQMSPELAKSWLEWALREDDISKSYSEARQRLAQAMSETVNQE